MAHPAGAPVPQARLDRDHVAGDERIASGQTKAGRFVDLEADAVTERVLEAVLLTVRGALRRIAGRLEELAGRVEELPAGDARANGRTAPPSPACVPVPCIST